MRRHLSRRRIKLKNLFKIYKEIQNRRLLWKSNMNRRRLRRRLLKDSTKWKRS